MTTLHTGHRRTIDYSILSSAQALREFVDQGLSDEAIGARVNVQARTVQAWRMVLGVKRPMVGRGTRLRGDPALPRAAVAQPLTREQFREITARVYRVRFSKCWDECPHGDECDGECPYEEQAEAA